MKPVKHLFILSKGKVAAINKKDGSIVWEIKLKDYAKNGTYGYGQIMLEADKLFIAVSGLLFCLQAKDGSLLWVNELKGWGYNFISMAGAGSEATSAASAATDAAVSAAVITASV